MIIPGHSVNYMSGSILAGAAVTTAIVWFLPDNLAYSLTREGGLIENLSLVVLGLGASCAMVTAARRGSLVWTSISLLLVWMVLRELDFQRRFTPRSIESLPFYLSPKYPWGMKVAALAALAPFAGAAVYLLASCVRAAKPGWLFAWRYPLALAAGLTIVASASEKLLPNRFQIVEEIAELAFACLVVLLVIHFVFQRATSPILTIGESATPATRPE